MNKETYLYPWQISTWQVILNLFKQKKVPHAILLVGQQGVGKSQFRQALEQMLLCDNPQDKACGHCRSCFLYQQDSHPDMKCLGKEDERISIENVREAIHFLSQTSHQKGPKVVSMLKIETLHLNASNALLKTLEEPSSDSFLLLETQKLSAVLPTIKSRCFILNLKLPTHQISVNWLKDQYPKEEVDVIQRCLTLVGGAPLNALKLLQSQPDMEKNFSFIRAFFLQKHATIDNNEQIQVFIENEPQDALYLMYYGLTEFIRSYLQCQTSFLCENEVARKLISAVPINQMYDFLDKISQALQTLTLPSINKMLLFESLYYQWQLISAGD